MGFLMPRFIHSCEPLGPDPLRTSGVAPFASGLTPAVGPGLGEGWESAGSGVVVEGGGSSAAAAAANMNSGNSRDTSIEEKRTAKKS